MMDKIAKLVWKSLGIVGVVLMVIGILTALIGLVGASGADGKLISLIGGLFIAVQGAFIVALNEVFHAILDTRDNSREILKELQKEGV